MREAAAIVAAQDEQYPDSLILACMWNLDYINYYFKKQGSTQRAVLRFATQKDFRALKKLLGKNKGTHLWLIRAHRKLRNPDLRENAVGQSWRNSFSNWYRDS